MALENVMRVDGGHVIGGLSNDAHTEGNVVDISDYSSASNPFTCPSDGYMRVVADVTVGNQTILYFMNGVTLAKAEVAIANHSDMITVYVKKGMRFYVTRSESTYSKVDYIPLQ